MLLRSINLPLTVIKNIGQASVAKFARLGIHNVAGLLCHYPRDWEDRSVSVPIKNFRQGQVCTKITVLSRNWIGYGKKRALKVYVEDESSRAALVCFNIQLRPWLDKQLMPGNCYWLWGNFKYQFGEIQSSSFEIAAEHSAKDANRVLPVYPLCAGINQTFFRRAVSEAIEKYAGSLENELPASIITRDGLLSKADAIRAIHFPASVAELELAKKTLIYEELFYLEIMVCKRAALRKKPLGAPAFISRPSGFSPLQQRLIERLPFSLTAGQQQAIAEINADFGHGYPFSMARLLQGDVGSGKTLAAFLAALKAADEGGQTALMAPTELLARQHAENAAALLEPLGLRIAFLTGNIKTAGRKGILKHLAEGEIDLIVGTHALFSKDVNYKNLMLVVIDEQHRFGVTQRSLIMAKGNNPHLLMMSATPIPRTLALTVFGDMDVSVINDMPPGRKPVKTHLAKESNEKKVYDFVRGKLDAGSQAYFVYPLIEETDESHEKLAGLKAAVSMSERLAQKVFPSHSVALIHSKLDEDEKRQTMERFRKGEIKILVATSVVEVGVDVPNANCMVIEHAERFGLSALHQLRGRVGRGGEQAFCFLVYSDELTEEGKTRLLVMLENANGFIIAEEDLKLRGPGQIAGIEQSGYLNLGIANPVRDADALVRARTDAFFIMENDSSLVLEDHQIIARVLDEAPPFSEVVL